MTSVYKSDNLLARKKYFVKMKIRPKARVQFSVYSPDWFFRTTGLSAIHKSEI